MRRTFWLLTLLPAALGTLWLAMDARPTRKEMETALLVAYQFPRQPLDPALPAAIRALQLASMEPLMYREISPSSGQVLISRENSPRIRNAFEAAGITAPEPGDLTFTAAPERLIQFNYSATYEDHRRLSQILLEAMPSDTLWIKNTSPIKVVDYHLSWGSGQYAMDEQLIWRFDQSPPIAERLSSFYEHGHPTWPLREVGRIRLSPGWVEYFGQLWPLALVILALPAPFLYLLRRPLSRLIPRRREFRKHSATTV